MATTIIKSKLSEDEKKDLRKATLAITRKRSAWKGAGLKSAPKKTMKGSSLLSTDAKKRKAQTEYLKEIGKDPEVKATRKQAAKVSYKKGKSSDVMKSHVSEGKKIPNMGEGKKKVTPHGSMKTGAKRKEAKAWRTKHMTAAKTGAQKQKVQKAFRHKIGKKKA